MKYMKHISHKGTPNSRGGGSLIPHYVNGADDFY
jgi:hypothetical protein